MTVCRLELAPHYKVELAAFESSEARIVCVTNSTTAT